MRPLSWEGRVQRLEEVVAALGQKPCVVAVMRALPHFLLPGFLFFLQLWFGHGIQEAFMLVSRLFASDVQRNAWTHPVTSLKG